MAWNMILDLLASDLVVFLQLFQCLCNVTNYPMGGDMVPEMMMAPVGLMIGSTSGLMIGMKIGVSRVLVGYHWLILLLVFGSLELYNLVHAVKSPLEILHER